MGGEGPGVGWLESRSGRGLGRVKGWGSRCGRGLWWGW